MYAIRSYYVFIRLQVETNSFLFDTVQALLQKRLSPLPVFTYEVDGIPHLLRVALKVQHDIDAARITSYNVCYTKLLRVGLSFLIEGSFRVFKIRPVRASS